MYVHVSVNSQSLFRCNDNNKIHRVTHSATTLCAVWEHGACVCTSADVDCIGGYECALLRIYGWMYAWRHRKNVGILLCSLFLICSVYSLHWMINVAGICCVCVVFVSNFILLFHSIPSLDQRASKAYILLVFNWTWPKMRCEHFETIYEMNDELWRKKRI